MFCVVKYAAFACGLFVLQNELCVCMSATHCNTPATHCNTLQRTATHCNALQRTARHYNTLQNTATHCNTRQYTITHCKCVYVVCDTVQHPRCRVCMYVCNTLQHTATRCTTLQHTDYTATLDAQCVCVLGHPTVPRQGSVLQRVAACCTVLQCVSVCIRPGNKN